MTDTAVGSSPLARGLPDGALKLVQVGRIIPARAGFTRSTTPSPDSRPDHPRSRGVYERLREEQRVPQGSSPLARGLPLFFFLQACKAGIIPARAGFTRPATSPKSLRADHPRSRGVYQALDVMTDTAVGSSPLARGLPEGTLKASPEERIIPARAGFTRMCHSRK